MLELLLLLVLGHLVCDYVLQTDTIAVGKSSLVGHAHLGVPWWYWMAAHAATHSLYVYALTNSALACVFEFLCHFVIDHLKCCKYFNLHVDQLLHVLCKLLIVLLFV